MELIVKVNMDNAAFEPWSIEASRILNQVAETLVDGHINRGAIMDGNGNKVGVWYLEGE